MQYNFGGFSAKGKEIEEWLKKELGGVRTGRASPSLLDSVLVEAYGSRMPISQLASISSEGPRTLRITPWDATQSKAVERAITLADLGVSVSVDDGGVRVSFPELTSERRTSLVKIAKDRLEDARITVRGAREESWSDIQEKEKAGEMTEDEKFRAKEELQKLVDNLNTSLQSIFERKEKEIME